MPKRDVQRRIDTAPSVQGGSSYRSSVVSTLSPHPLDSAYHTGTIGDAQAPQFLKTDGTRVLLGHLSVATGITIDGVDLDVHAADPDAHHQHATVVVPLQITGLQQISLLFGANPGLTGDANGLVLGPLGVTSTLSTTSTNAVSGVNHTHAITTTADGGANPNTIIKSDANGRVDLTTLGTSYIVAPGDLHIDPTGKVTFPVSQTLRSTNFASTIPIAGWQINESPTVAGWSVLTIGVIQSDEIHTRVFVADETRIDRGEEIWGKSRGILSASFTTPSALGQSVRIYFEDSPALNGAIFSSGDWLLFRVVDMTVGLTVASVWGTVSSYIDEANDQQSWLFTLQQGPTSWELKKGTVAVDLGQSGQGYIMNSAIDQAGSPYVRIAKWSGANPYTPANISVPAQYGNLNSVSSVLGSPVGDWGIFIQGTSTLAELSDAGVYLRGAQIKQYNGATQTVEILATGSVKFGSNVTTNPGTTFYFDSSTGALRLGPGTGGPTAHWTGSQIELRDSNAQAVITLDGAGNSYFSNVMTIGVNGEIRQGTGTIGSTFTGLRIWRESNIGRIGGYSSGVSQWSASTTGKLIAGGGNVALSSLGLDLTIYGYDYNELPATENQRAISWWPDAQNPSGTPIARIWATYNSGTGVQPYLVLEADPGNADPDQRPALMLWGFGKSVWFLVNTVVGFPGLDASRNPTTGVETIEFKDQVRSKAHIIPTSPSAVDLGSSGSYWRKLYVDEIVAGTITGGTGLVGQIWQYDAGDMYVRSNSSGSRTLYVANPGTGQMHLDVEGNIVVGGLVDGVDVASLGSSFTAHVSDANAHHAKSHVLATTSALGSDHTVSGLTAGMVLRAASATTAAFSTLAHSELASLTSGDDHTQYVHISTARTVTARHTFNPGSAASPFIIGANASGQLVSGLNADQVDGVHMVGTAQYQVPVTGATPFTPAWTALSTYAGAGLAWTSNAFAVGAGTLISVAADTVGVSNGTAQYQVPVTGATPFTPAWTALSTYAGAGLAWSNNAFAVGAGTLISVAGTSVGLANGTAQYQIIMTGANPYTPAWTSMDGMAGNGLNASGGQLHVVAGNGIALASDAVTVNQAYNFAWTGTHTFSNTITARHILPELTDTYDVGSETLWWRQQFVSQINATIFAKETIQLYGGWLMVAKNAVKLPAIGSAATQIDFGTSMTPGDIVLIRSHDAGGNIKVEYLSVGTLVSGTNYNVTRDLAGAHTTDPEWPDGTPAAVLGQNGNGRIEMSAYTSPRLSMIVQGAAYNSQTETVRIGDLNGMPGVSTETWGAFIGDASQYLKYANGVLTIAGNGSGLTSISGGNITTGSITADKLNVTALSAITADLGTVTAGQITVGPSDNKIWLNDNGLGGLSVGGTNNATAPFRVTSSGFLFATDAYITGDITATSGSITGTLSITGSGKLAAGSSTVLDANGLYLQAYNTGIIGIQNSVSWQTSLGSPGLHTAAYIGAFGSAGLDWLYLGMDSFTTSDKKFEIALLRSYGGSSISASFVMEARRIAVLETTATLSSTYIYLTGSVQFSQSPTVSGLKIWNEGNDGPSSGLNADLLDNQEGSYYLPASSYTAADVLTKLKTVDGHSSLLDADRLDGQEGSYYLPASSYTAADVLTKLKTVDGSGSGLDADLLDSLQLTASGDRWGVIPYVASDGTMEIGKYLDFHDSDADASDAAIRLTSSGASLTLGGTLTVTGSLYVNLSNGALGAWADFSTWGTGWGNYGTPFANVQYRRWGDIIYVRGMAKATTATPSTVICQLPYTGSYQQILVCMGNFGGTQRELRVDVLTNGQISIASAGATPTTGQWISLEFQIPYY